MKLPAHIVIPPGYRLIRSRAAKPGPHDLGLQLDVPLNGAATLVGVWVPYADADFVDLDYLIRPTKTTLKRFRKAAKS